MSKPRQKPRCVQCTRVSGAPVFRQGHTCPFKEKGPVPQAFGMAAPANTSVLSSGPQVAAATSNLAIMAQQFPAVQGPSAFTFNPFNGAPQQPAAVTFSDTLSTLNLSTDVLMASCDLSDLSQLDHLPDFFGTGETTPESSGQPLASPTHFSPTTSMDLSLSAMLSSWSLGPGVDTQLVTNDQALATAIQLFDEVGATSEVDAAPDPPQAGGELQYVATDHLPLGASSTDDGTEGTLWDMSGLDSGDWFKTLPSSESVTEPGLGSTAHELVDELRPALHDCSTSESASPTEVRDSSPVEDSPMSCSLESSNEEPRPARLTLPRRQRVNVVTFSGKKRKTKAQTKQKISKVQYITNDRQRSQHYYEKTDRILDLCQELDASTGAHILVFFGRKESALLKGKGVLKMFASDPMKDALVDFDRILGLLQHAMVEHVRRSLPNAKTVAGMNAKVAAAEQLITMMNELLNVNTNDLQ